MWVCFGTACPRYFLIFKMAQLSCGVVLAAFCLAAALIRGWASGILGLPAGSTVISRIYHIIIMTIIINLLI